MPLYAAFRRSTPLYVPLRRSKLVYDVLRRSKPLYATPRRFTPLFISLRRSKPLNTTLCRSISHRAAPISTHLFRPFHAVLPRFIPQRTTHNFFELIFVFLTQCAPVCQKNEVLLSKLLWMCSCVCKYLSGSHL